MKRRGMTLIELLVAMAILVIILGMSGIKLKGLLQRARAAAAKSTISGFELALKNIKIDTGFYPESLSDTKATEAPTGFSADSWYGPYAETLSLVDPWGNNYYYKLIDGVIFGPKVFQMSHTGPPYDETFTFSTIPGIGNLLIDNSSLPVSAGRVWLNGIEVVSPDEFGQQVTTIEKSVTFLANNTLRVWIASDAKGGMTGGGMGEGMMGGGMGGGLSGNYFTLTLTSPKAGKASFILLSYGGDGKPGGLGVDADIIDGKF